MDELDKKLCEEIQSAQPELRKDQLEDLYRFVAQNQRRPSVRRYRLKHIYLLHVCVTIILITFITIIAFTDNHSKQNIPDNSYLDFGQFLLTDIVESDIPRYLPDTLWPISALESCEFEQARTYSHESVVMATEIVYTKTTEPIPIPSTINLFIQLKDSFVYKYDDDYVHNAVVKTINTVEVLSTDLMPENELPQQYRKFIWQNLIFYLRVDTLYENFADDLVTNILR